MVRMKSNRSKPVQVKFQVGDEIVRYHFEPEEYVDVDEEHVDYLPQGFTKKPGPSVDEDETDETSDYDMGE